MIKHGFVGLSCPCEKDSGFVKSSDQGPFVAAFEFFIKC